jgi:hypothetical protein
MVMRRFAGSKMSDQRWMTSIGPELWILQEHAPVTKSNKQDLLYLLADIRGSSSANRLIILSP